MRSARQQREGTRIFGYPRAYIVIPTIQLILAVILICLGIYSTTVLIFTGSILTIFTSLCTIAIAIWLLCAHSCAPGVYNPWAVLVLNIFLFIFWLLSLVLLASRTAFAFDYNSHNAYCSVGDCGLTNDSVLAGATALSGIEFLLHLVALIINSTAIHRHRRDKRARTFVDADDSTYQMQNRDKPAYRGVPSNTHAEATYNMPAPNAPYSPEHVPLTEAPAHGTAQSELP